MLDLTMLDLTMQIHQSICRQLQVHTPAQQLQVLRALGRLLTPSEEMLASVDAENRGTQSSGGDDD